MITANEMSVIRSIIRTEMNNQKSVRKETDPLNKMEEIKDTYINIPEENESTFAYSIGNGNTRNMLAK